MDLPLTIYDNAGISFIGIFPDGYGTEFPSGKRSNIDENGEEPVAFDINMKESQAKHSGFFYLLLLATKKRRVMLFPTWSVTLRMCQPPSG